LRKIAEGATADLREGLGPEFKDLELDDLNPRRFVQKHLLDDLDTPGTREEVPVPTVATQKDAAATGGPAGAGVASADARSTDTGGVAVGKGAATATAVAADWTPFDIDAT